YDSIDKWRAIGTTTRLGGARKADDRDETRWFDTINRQELFNCLAEFYRLAAKDAFIWVCCDHEIMPVILGMVREGGELGFTYSKPYPVLKRAKTGGYRQGTGYHGRASHEYVVLLKKGKK